MKGGRKKERREEEGNGHRTNKRWKRYMRGRWDANKNTKGMQKI
jgi:hypothetical protein